VCDCDAVGAVEEVCDKSDGQCLCKEVFNGDRCDVCARGYYAYPDCIDRNACVRSQEALVMTAKISQDSVNVSLTMQDRTVIDVLLDSTAIQTVSVSMQGTQF